MTQQLALGAEPIPHAVFSSARGGGADGLGLYRYQLEWPTGLANPTMVLFVLANPSTATHLVADPTVTRCINFARTWGFGVCGVANVRAWRETDPKKLPPDPIAIGPCNDAHILGMARRASLVVCGWGRLGGARGLDVLKLLRENDVVPHALRLTPDGVPYHPLYLKKISSPFPMEAP